MEATISTRSRNLGYGWTNAVIRNRPLAGWSLLDVERTAGGLTVEQPVNPNCTGGLRTIETEMRRAARLNSGNDWRDALFVGLWRVVAVWGQIPVTMPRINDDGTKTGEWTFRDGWFIPSDNLSAYVVSELREGRKVRVKLGTEI